MKNLDAQCSSLVVNTSVVEQYPWSLSIRSGGGAEVWAHLVSKKLMLLLSLSFTFTFHALPSDTTAGTSLTSLFCQLTPLSLDQQTAGLGEEERRKKAPPVCFLCLFHVPVVLLSLQHAASFWQWQVLPIATVKSTLQFSSISYLSFVVPSLQRHQKADASFAEVWAPCPLSSETGVEQLFLLEI